MSGFITDNTNYKQVIKKMEKRIGELEKQIKELEDTKVLKLVGATPRMTKLKEKNEKINLNFSFFYNSRLH